MNTLIEQLQTAQQEAMANRPKIGGFPYLAEKLRQAGVKRNTWSLPSCQSIYWMGNGQVVQQMPPLVNEPTLVPEYDEKALIAAIRADQEGKSTFPEFLQATWQSGVIWYQLDLEKRTVTYGGADCQTYSESYPKAVIYPTEKD